MRLTNYPIFHHSFSFIVICLMTVILPCSVLAHKKPTKEKELSNYEKLFKNKKYTSAKGLFTFHLIDDKLYVELPLSILNKPFLVGTSIEEVSDPQESSIGQHLAKPIRAFFQQRDSVVEFCRSQTPILAEHSEKIRTAVQKSSIAPILETFPIKAYTDSSVVFDMTSFLFKDDPQLTPMDPKAFNSMDGWVIRKMNFSKERSLISTVSATSESVSVTCCMSYDESMSVLGLFSSGKKKPFTAFVKRTFLQLPEQNTYEPLLADKRVGTLTTTVYQYSGDQQGSKKIAYASRWNLKERPLVLYVDTLFPSDWQNSIQQCVKQWNGALVKAGVRNSIQLKPYEKEMDPNDIRYSCIHYVLTPSNAITDNVWMDPANGEIIAANIYVPHNFPQIVQRNMFLQTAAFNPTARNIQLSDKDVAPALTTQLLRSIGHCLGLSDNMAGSIAFPTDSLRSASFTSQNGLSASVMDKLPFNYLLSSQENNKGVLLTQQSIGSYDNDAIRWLYGPEGSPVPAFLYSRPQPRNAYYDPRGMSGDLGNDAIKSVQYAFNNLAVLVKNADKWLDSQDEDYSYREELYGHLLNQTSEYVTHVLQQVGGIYLNTKQANDSVPAYQPVSKDLQRKSFCWMMDQIEKMDWLDDNALIEHSGSVGKVSDYAQKFFGNFIFVQLNAMTLSESKSNNPYTQPEAESDVENFILQETKAGKVPSELKRFLQNRLVDFLISGSNIQPSSKETTDNGPISFVTSPEYSSIWYEKLLNLKKTYSKAVLSAPTQELKDEYAYREYTINKAMKNR